MKLEGFVTTTVKRSLGLPIHVTDTFFYVPTSKGGLGLKSIEDKLTNQTITKCTKMLSSPDDFVKGLQQLPWMPHAKEVRTDQRT